MPEREAREPCQHGRHREERDQLRGVVLVATGPYRLAGDRRRDQPGEQPVDQQREQPAAPAGDRARAVLGQAEPVARIAELFGGSCPRAVRMMP